jgi:Tol biopolymer transport system component
MLVAVLVFSAPALASKERPYTGVSFGPTGTGVGSFVSVQGVTVDQATGDVFVYDDGEGGRIYKFDAAGEPVNFSALGTNVITGVGSGGGAEDEVAVDSSSGPAAGDIYAANNGEVKIYSAEGSSLGSLSGGEMCGVAVDASGVVYVGIYSAGTVRKYVPTANPVTNASEASSMGGLGGICNVAADSEGNLYAANWSGGVARYEALQFGSLAAMGALIDGSGRTLEVDQATNALYVNEGSAIAEYDASGNLIGTSGSEKINGSFGVGVDSAKNELYVPSEGRVLTFGPPVLLPTVSGGEASEITNSSARISGSVNPEGTATTYQFQYGTTTSYGSVEPVSPQSVGSDSTPHEVSVQLTGLSLGTTYHYRLVATGANGTSYGQDRNFKTSGPSVIGGSASKEAQNSLTVGAYIETGELDTHYQVEYGTSNSYGSTTSSVDMGSESGPVSQELTGLQPETTYHYRFAVTNSEGTAYGADHTASTTPVARIVNEGISGASSTEATLKATVEAFGAESTYQFEYGPTSAYGAATPEEAFSSEAQATLMGLPAETTYHFRVVIKNQYGTVEGEDATFTTAPTPSLILPDSRRYEKVTPNNNADGNVIPNVPASIKGTPGIGSLYTDLPFMAAADGNALAYIAQASENGGTGSEGAGGGNQYLSRRASGGGWATETIEPTGSSNLPTYEGFTKNLTAGFFNYNGKNPLVTGAPGEEYSVLYKRMSGTGAFEPLINIKPPNRGPNEFSAVEVARYGGSPWQPAYAGSSADLSHVLFMANDALTPGAKDGGNKENNLYDTHDGVITLVNVLPDGSTEPNATFGGPKLSYDPATPDAPSFSHDISEDGRRIFWTDLNSHNLYLREDGSRTVEVDAGAGGGGAFWTATPDGSKVLFTKAGDLYQYDVESGQTSDLTPGGEVQGVVGASEDLSYIYFVADTALASGSEPEECLTPSAGSENTSSCNLYVLHQGEPVRFITKLAADDNFAPFQSPGADGDWQSGMGNREAEVTPDGRHLVFTSSRSLTGYDNSGPEEVAGRGAEEVFTYDYGSTRLLCASCDPSGLSPAHSYSAFLRVSNVNTYTLRWMSSDGRKVFFSSIDALVPQDTNGVFDVYEWEEDGAGGCRRSQGCIYLLSSGSSPENSWLLDASENGDDVFIATRSQLTLEDQNEDVDAYDVRANAPIPQAPPQCSGTGCQGAASSPPVFATPSSVTYNGVGNFPAPVKANSKAKKPKRKATQGKHKKKAKKKGKGGRRRKAKKSAHKSAKSHGRNN